MADYNSVLAFSSYLCKALRSASDESLEPSQIFSEHAHSPGCAHRPMHVPGILDSKEYIGDYQSPYGQLIPQLYILNFWLGLLLVPTFIYLLGSYDLKQLLLFSKNAYIEKNREKGFPTGWAPNQNK